MALSERQDANFLDTLAKVLAENSRFDEAVRTQQEALEKLQTPEWRSDFEARLREYERARALQKIDAAP